MIDMDRAYARAEMGWSRYDESEGYARVECEQAQAQRDSELGVRPWYVTAETADGPASYTVHASCREVAMASADAVGRTRYPSFVTVDVLHDSASTVAEEWFDFVIWYKDGLHIVDVVDYRRGFKQFTFSTPRKLRAWTDAGVANALRLDTRETDLATRRITEYMAELTERQVA